MFGMSGPTSTHEEGTGHMSVTSADSVKVQCPQWRISANRYPSRVCLPDTIDVKQVGAVVKQMKETLEAWKRSREACESTVRERAT